MEKNISNIENGTMASNMDELRLLGKQMERMRDGTQLEENDRISDPIQLNGNELELEEKELN